jgi:flagellar biosynthetic protein FlhB
VSSDKHSKTEKPTAKRKREARRDGNVAKSPEIGTWISILAASFLIRNMVRSANSLERRLWRHAGTAISRADMGLGMKLFGESLAGFALTVAPLLLGLMLVGVATNVAQIGWAFKPFKVKFKNLNPLPGIKRLFSPTSAWQTGKDLLKLTILIGLAWKTLAGVVPALTTHGPMPVGAVLGTVANRAMDFIRNVAFLGLSLAAVDYGLMRRRISKSMMMSKQEIKDESRQSEGDPKMKGEIRARQRKMSRLRMMAAIATADAIVVNPTHVSVAIKYDPKRGAPRVVAKGADEMAARIREEAAKHNIPMVEDVPLARTMYRLCEIGDEIPAQLYEAVARLLAFLYAVRATGRSTPIGGGAHRPPEPLLTV